MARKQVFDRLITEFGKNIDVACPLPEYPRPQMVRDSYINLNGEWDYAITPMKVDNPQYSGKILVPFSPEAVLSGVEHILQPDEFFYYKRYFTLPEGFNRGRVLLNFGAVDYECEVILNDISLMKHRGGYYPFTVDITAALRPGENKLVVKVFDPSDTAPGSHGKQKLKRGGIFYTPQSGIWQTVWLESVPEKYVTALYLTPDIDRDTLEIRVQSNEGAAEGKVAAYDGEKLIAEGEIKDGSAVLNLKDYELWSPENPKLYSLKIVVGEDETDSYFGMRKFSVGKDARGIPRMMLNNKPYFHNGLLDQGYWPDGLYTPPSDEAMIFDIAEMKALGFNMLRKHIKLEPMRWYYHCDRLGMLVWQDMVNGGMGANRIVGAVRRSESHRLRAFSRLHPSYRSCFRLARPGGRRLLFAAHLFPTRNDTRAGQTRQGSDLIGIRRIFGRGGRSRFQQVEKLRLQKIFRYSLLRQRLSQALRAPDSAAYSARALRYRLYAADRHRGRDKRLVYLRQKGSEDGRRAAEEAERQALQRL